MFRRILIANRGEIALRILRACRTLGVEAVVAYSEADRDSLPAQLADEAICIGPADARRSYLSAPAVISAALVTGCDAIHPGYGFLSEDETFAEVVRAHDLTFIGPPPDVLDRFASKEGTRRLLGGFGLPTIPGSDSMLRDDDHALSEAERIGYPVLIKPSAGGGGKGMRMVRTSRELESAIKICRSEAKSAFGDDSLYLEKWLDDNRHVEVQVAVDRYGAGIHLGERDCSVQRRHQKILEEGPTPALSPDGARRPRGDGDPRGRGRRLRERGHARVPRRRRRATPTSSRSTAASRSSTRSPRCSPASTSSRSRSGSRPASRSGCASRTSSAAATPSSSGSTPRTRRTTSGPAPASSSSTTRPAGRASGWTRTCIRATRSRRTTTRCSASSSSGAPIAPTAIARGRTALEELLVDGVTTNVEIHRALLDNETFLEGEMTTNLLDRVGGAAFLAAAAAAPR